MSGKVIRHSATVWHAGSRFAPVLLALANVAPAMAQSPPLHRFPTTNGCDVVLPIYTSNVRVNQPVELGGPCTGGLAQGPGRLVYVLESPLGTRKVVVRSTLVAGRLHGLTWFLNRALPQPETNEELRLTIRHMLDGHPGPVIVLDARMPLSEIHAKATAFADTASSSNQSMSKAELLEELARWHRDPAAFPGAAIGTSAEPAQPRPDDPKVRGRSARVM